MLIRQNRPPGKLKDDKRAERACLQTQDALQDHPVDYWQDADEDFWEDPVSSPDRISASPAVSPAKESILCPPGAPASHAQQSTAHEGGALIAADPTHEVAAAADPGVAEAPASEEGAQPASNTRQIVSRHDGLNVAHGASGSKAEHLAAAGAELRTQQVELKLEGAASAAGAGQQVLASEVLKKQPSDVPGAYPLIVRAGAVPGPPSRQTSSEFLASIAGTPQSARYILLLPCPRAISFHSLHLAFLPS